jgi:hypothetical protein
MVSPFKSRGFLAAAVFGVSLVLMLPAHAQFWDWGNRPQQQRDFTPFGGNQRWDRWEGGWRERERQRDRGRGDRDRGERERDRDTPIDYSHAPGPSQKKPEAKTSIVVLGRDNRLATSAIEQR